MKTFIFVFFLFAIVGLIPGFVQAEVTGSQCQSHLAQVTEILKREKLSSYWKVSDEITNFLGTSLDEISKVNGQDADVTDFVDSVKSTLNECQSNCAGISDRQGKRISCQTLKNQTVLDVNLLIKNIDGHSVAKVEDSRPSDGLSSVFDTHCSGGLETDTCQIYLDERESRHITLLGLILSQCSGEKSQTDTCQILIDSAQQELERMTKPVSQESQSDTHLLSDCTLDNCEYDTIAQ